jgi:hypothetical protein
MLADGFICVGLLAQLGFVRAASGRLQSGAPYRAGRAQISLRYLHLLAMADELQRALISLAPFRRPTE